jgi:hypothetical protein
MYKNIVTFRNISNQILLIINNIQISFVTLERYASVTKSVTKALQVALVNQLVSTKVLRNVTTKTCVIN